MICKWDFLVMSCLPVLEQLLHRPKSMAYIDYDNMELIYFHLYGKNFRTVRRVTSKDHGRTKHTELGYEILDENSGRWVTKVYYDLAAYRHSEVAPLEDI